MQSRTNTMMVDVLLGAAVGAAATWVMNQVTTAMYKQEPEEARQQENEARGGKTAYGVAAEKSAQIAGVSLSEDRRKQLGSQIHWGLGIGMGVIYAVLRRQAPVTAWGNGALYGTAFWLLMDEGAVTALGLTPPPGAFPRQTHMRGLIGHLAFGLTADTLLDILDTVPLDHALPDYHAG